MQITYDDFEKVDIRLGKIIEVEDFPKAKKPAYKLKIDFGKEIGVKSSSAQITKHYKKDELIGRMVMCVVNFQPKNIAGFTSEVLTLGVPDRNGDVVLLGVDKENIELGARMF